MARIKITEYCAKRLLLGDVYSGIGVGLSTKIVLPKKGTYVVKVDQGIKKRFKQGLVKVAVPASTISSILTEFKNKKFFRFLVEPYVVHDADEEQYLSFERVREGIRMLFTSSGGVDIEAHPEAVQTFLIRNVEDLGGIANKTKLPLVFLVNTISIFNAHYFVFLEINPLVVKEGTVHLLDAACLVDSAGEFFVHNSWTKDDVVEAKSYHRAEENVHILQSTTPASLKLTVLHPEGSLFFLLSGGGGSIVIADEAQLEGFGNEIGNYGEYSGAPTREETYLYTKEILGLVLASPKKKTHQNPEGKKALVIAGGVANFTNIKSTFAGVIDALREHSSALRASKVKVFVRRGGPHEAEGLADIRSFLKEEDLFGAVSGSTAPITEAVQNAIHYLKS